MDPARSDETWESRAGMVRLRETRCTVEAGLEPARPAADVDARSGAGVEEGELEDVAGLPDPDEERSVFVDRTSA